MPTEGENKGGGKSAFHSSKKGRFLNFMELITALKYKCFVKSPGREFNKAVRRMITAGYNSSKTFLKYI